ncbi:MAG: tryptophan-rich sensory protein [Ruminococcaceae bacterium]|nr:tryptophan-rich sensory protein [Oscillospiraceae bacterium]
MRSKRNKLLASCCKLKTDGKTVIAGTVSVLIAGLLSRFLSGSPIYILRFTGLWHKVPPLWFFSLIWTLWYILLGFCFGFILGSRPIGKDVFKYKGSLWFVIMMIFNIVWYPLFFKAGAFFLALVDAGLIIFFALLTAFEYYKIHKIVGCLIFIHIFWLVWCLGINLRVFFSI